VITNRTTKRVTSQPSAQDVFTVDTGIASSKKSSAIAQRNILFHARTDHGPGVFFSGADALQPNPSRRLRADPVRHGNPSVAVPL
jgi:hypothetical protein